MLRTILAALMAAALLLLAGCAPAATVTPGEPSAVTYYDGTSTTEVTKEAVLSAVASGKLTARYETVTETAATAEVTLGMPSTELTALFANADPVREAGVRYIRYTCGGSFYYYTNDGSENGLAAVVYYGPAYGFEPGVTTKAQVARVLGDAPEQPAGEDALSMFLYRAAGSTFYDYAAGDNRLSFYFNDSGVLSALALYQAGLWIT